MPFHRKCSNCGAEMHIVDLSCEECGNSVRNEKSPRLNEFDETASKITQVRGKIYPHPSIDFRRIEQMKAILRDCAHPEARHAMEMIAIKLCRLIQTPDHMDSWIDIAGYARCGVMVTEPNEEKSNANT